MLNKFQYSGVLLVNVMGHSSAKTSSLIPLKLSTSRTAFRPVVTLPSACGSPSKRPTITAFSTKVVRRNLNAKPVPLARGSALLDTMVKLAKVNFVLFSSFPLF